MVDFLFGRQSLDEVDVTGVAAREAAAKFVFADGAKHCRRILQRGRENANLGAFEGRSEQQIPHRHPAAFFHVGLQVQPWGGLG
ncbi:MAG: hypothetical protein WA563_09550, partial [Candidatus Acidiferrales bacterium]